MAKKKTKNRGGLAPDKYLSDDQVKKLRRYVRDRADLARQRGGSRGVIDELIIELLLASALRASELVDLTIADLPCEHGKPCLYVRDGKGSVSRSVDISEKLELRISRFVKLYRKGANSDDPLITKPMELSAGSISAGALELSNVDLSREFINLIVSSTGFSACSRVIQTSDRLLNELIMLVR